MTDTKGKDWPPLEIAAAGSVTELRRLMGVSEEEIERFAAEAELWAPPTQEEEALLAQLGQGFEERLIATTLARLTTVQSSNEEQFVALQILTVLSEIEFSRYLEGVDASVVVTGADAVTKKLVESICGRVDWDSGEEKQGAY